MPCCPEPSASCGPAGSSGEFHARHRALNRTYHYLLLDDAVAPGLLRSKAGWFHRRLDVAAMNEAARSLEGEHDFSAFRDSQCQARSPVRSVHEARVERAGSLVVFTVRANAFLHHMVRNFVGSLVYVGAGRQPVSWIAELLERRDRRSRGADLPSRRPLPLGHRV